MIQKQSFMTRQSHTFQMEFPMLSLIPEDPTPAQKRLIESDWFASALEKMPEGSDISFALWSQATWKAVRQMPSVKVSPEAQWLNSSRLSYLPNNFIYFD